MLSPGIAQGCFEFLGVAASSLMKEGDVHKCFPNFGTIPGKTIVHVALSLGWIRTTEDNRVLVTSSGERLLGIATYPLQLRQALRDLVQLEKPPWIQNAVSGRARVIAYVGTELAQTMIEAELLTRDGPDEVAFWDFLAAMARGEQDARLLHIGRTGERLTLEYELARTGRAAKWIAIDANEDGYDVLSIVSTEKTQSLAIEVKSSTVGPAGTVFLSRNEWDRSEEFKNYCFHFWDLEVEARPRLAVVTREEVAPHVPTDCGRGTWKELCIPLHVFQHMFAALELTQP